MIRTPRDSSLLASCVVLLGLLAVMPRPAQAQVVKPFKVNGAGTVDYVPLAPLVPVAHDAVGQGTGLGRYYGFGQVQLLGFTGPATADFDSAVPFTFIAANEDQLVFTYGDATNGASGPGQVTLQPAGDGLFIAVWVAEFNPVPTSCTGRFAKVVGGSFIMTAVTELFALGAFDPVPYSWSGEGTLKFGK